MTKTVELEVAQATLSELIDGLCPDEEVVIVRNQKRVARLLPPKAERAPRQPGLLKDAITVIAGDDDHLKDFEKHMP